MGLFAKVCGWDYREATENDAMLQGWEPWGAVTGELLPLKGLKGHSKEQLLEPKDEEAGWRGPSQRIVTSDEEKQPACSDPEVREMENKLSNFTHALPLTSYQCFHWPNGPKPNNKDENGVLPVGCRAHRAEWRQDLEG